MRLSLEAFSFFKCCILRRRRGFPRSRSEGAIGNCITFNNRKTTHTHASKFKNDLEERRVRNTLLLHNRFSLAASGKDAFNWEVARENLPEKWGGNLQNL